MPNPENIEKYKMKKGETLNPNGRPKGSKNRSTIAKKWLEAQDTIKNPITGKNEKLSQEDVMTLAMIKEARKGNVNAYSKLMDSAYGQPKQTIDQNITEKPIFKEINLDVSSNDSTEEN